MALKLVKAWGDHEPLDAHPGFVIDADDNTGWSGPSGEAQPEAAARLRDLPGGLGWLPALPPHERGASDGETVCRHLLGWVRAALQDQPERRHTITDRLEAEFREHLRQHDGKVVLP